MAHTMMTPSVALVAGIAPRRSVLRPSELEDPTFAKLLEAEALTGPAAILDRRSGVRTAMQGNRLVTQQAGAWAALDAEATLVIVRRLAQGSDRATVLRGILEEDVTEGLELEMAFVGRVLAMIDEQLIETMSYFWLPCLPPDRTDGAPALSWPPVRVR